MDDASFVRALYTAILGRQPDPEGFAKYLSDLQEGFDPKDLFDVFLRSNEYNERTRRSRMGDAAFVRALYIAILGRQPDPKGFAKYLSDLQEGFDPKDLFDVFLRSDEYSERARRLQISGEKHACKVSKLNNDSIVKQRDIASLMSCFTPKDIIGLSKIRIGRPYDGGYVMIDDFHEVTAAYSLGISDDVSWDGQIADLGIPLYQYDHSIDKLPYNHPNFIKWAKIKIASETCPTGSAISLKDAFLGNSHDAKDDFLLKVDIEGAEWEVFEKIDVEFLKCFRQIVCEFHYFSKANFKTEFSMMLAAMLNLTSSHVPVHVHGNNFSPFVDLNGIPVPDTIEVTFVRMDRGSFVDGVDTYPTMIDQPNDPEVEDLYLSNFRFI